MVKKMLSVVIGVLLCVNGVGLAIDHYWHGGVSANVNDPANWTDRNASTPPTTPTGDPYDIVRIGCAWGSEDLNGNGVLDLGEDLNGNGVIDDPVPPNVISYGGYYGTYGDPPVTGGGLDLAVDPVLSDTYVSRTGGERGGWWFVANAPNILTLKDGASLIMSRENCNLRNGGRLEVQGRSSTGGPSLIVARRFRIAENGSIAEAAHETSQLRITGTGWMQMDPTLHNNGEAFMIGTSDAPGTRPRGEIVIEDQGRLEILSADPAPWLDFGNADPSVNQIILMDQGELWLPGDPATMGRVGPDNTVTSLQEMIAMGLITGGKGGGPVTVTGVNPTVVRSGGQRVSDPQPAHGTPDTDRSVTLRWDPSTLTDRYDVYLGTDAGEVNEATRANPLGLLKAQDQTEASYPPEGMLTLEYGRTYYWRVDEVGAAPDKTTLQGKVWSFSVEPYVIPLAAQSISATASSQSPDQGPEKTIDGSGLDANDLHSTVLTDMWLSGTDKPVWIEYGFDKTYKIQEMFVWNYNGQSILTALGLKDVTVEVSADSAERVPLAGVLPFEPASGTAGYAHNTTVAFGGIPVSKVRITANTNWATSPLFNKFGLSEVRFLHIPVSARRPGPESGATEVPIDAALSWRVGREAAEHRVVLSSDQQAVVNDTAPAVTVLQAAYSPPSLNLGTTYYWRVDEVNQVETPAVWRGDIWTFATADFAAVDDFEAYNDQCNRVYYVWKGGAGNSANAECGVSAYGGNGTGSVVGNDSAPYAERGVVHSGLQAMPLAYNGPSEATRTFDAAQDWTVGAITTLVVFFQGDPANTPGELYVKINGTKVSYTGDAGRLATAAWTQWDIGLSSVAGLGSVQSLTIGVASGQGELIVDDIRLVRSAPGANP
ncbi:MAG: hypothetical protein KBE04_09565 [Phycisphaerae bacterium]|nr:hypothetical protein [Phycisphaerae bacterium]